MNLVRCAAYLPFINAVLFGLLYALLQELYGAVSFSTILLTNGILYVLIALLSWLLGYGEISHLPLDSNKMVIIFVVQLIIMAVVQVTHFISLKNTSATYMAFAELGYPLFVPIFAYLLFSREELSRSIAVGGLFIFLGSIIIARGGVPSH